MERHCRSLRIVVVDVLDNRIQYGPFCLRYQLERSAAAGYVRVSARVNGTCPAFRWELFQAAHLLPGFNLSLGLLR